MFLVSCVNFNVYNYLESSQQNLSTKLLILNYSSQFSTFPISEGEYNACYITYSILMAKV